MAENADALRLYKRLGGGAEESGIGSGAVRSYRVKRKVVRADVDRNVLFATEQPTRAAVLPSVEVVCTATTGGQLLRYISSSYSFEAHTRVI